MKTNQSDTFNRARSLYVNCARKSINWTNSVVEANSLNQSVDTCLIVWLLLRTRHRTHNFNWITWNKWFNLLGSSFKQRCNRHSQRQTHLCLRFVYCFAIYSCSRSPTLCGNGKVGVFSIHNKWPLGLVAHTEEHTKNKNVSFICLFTYSFADPLIFLLSELNKNQQLIESAAREWISLLSKWWKKIAFLVLFIIFFFFFL